MTDKDALWHHFIEWQKREYPVAIAECPEEGTDKYGAYYARVIQFLNDELDLWIKSSDEVLDMYLEIFGIDLEKLG